MGIFEHLFKYESYQDEENVHFYKYDGVKEIGEPVCIPETLFNRMTCIGNAYNLHYTSLFSPYEDYVLESIQVQGLIEELNFIADTVNDKLLQRYINELLHLIGVCGYSPKCPFIKIMGY
ncbi:hypothetical protein [Desulfosporosinus sp. BICA1-9]|uniref:hypothetical protein n=1 Tax=Desulfosporosinus sp. BICA1-9 TaxID=1531958 RepID=UPI00054B063A|nr:hypothetical protein [Desulfosporosinus sp. BICA1-9]KJS47651.1 MAG: hypothetical protein VR66_18480 [Peptococcaceae bacterium BRH_c23]KJS89145.1 MAG: hypothetical protein JL57_09025 [Desulfosporosinus sp. BICA1-9]HBW38522.1 hypothetical protein [Desulfosporosinus sp.]